MEISVVMSVYNAEKYLTASIESILKQTFESFELIIINDGSTDESLRIINSFSDNRIVIINHENQGLSKSLNRGIERAEGKYIARMDADDIASPDRLEKQYYFMQNNAECVLVGSAAHILDEEGKFLYTHRVQAEWEEIRKILPENPIFHSSAFFLKNIWEKAGKYPEEVIHFFEDKILWNRMSLLGQIRNISEALLYYRLSPSSISNNDFGTALKLRCICNDYLKQGYWTRTNREHFEQIVHFINRSKSKEFYYHLRIGHIYLNQNPQVDKALIHFFKCVQLRPLESQGWKGIFFSLIPHKAFQKLKQIKSNIRRK